MGDLALKADEMEDCLSPHTFHLKSHRLYHRLFCLFLMLTHLPHLAGQNLICSLCSAIHHIHEVYRDACTRKLDELSETLWTAYDPPAPLPPLDFLWKFINFCGCRRPEALWRSANSSDASGPAFVPQYLNFLEGSGLFLFCRQYTQLMTGWCCSTAYPSVLAQLNALSLNASSQVAQLSSIKWVGEVDSYAVDWVHWIVPARAPSQFIASSPPCNWQLPKPASQEAKTPS